MILSRNSPKNVQNNRYSSPLSLGSMYLEPDLLGAAVNVTKSMRTKQADPSHQTSNNSAGLFGTCRWFKVACILFLRPLKNVTNTSECWSSLGSWTITSVPMTIPVCPVPWEVPPSGTCSTPVGL